MNDTSNPDRPIEVVNLINGLPAASQDELFTTLLARPGVKIERIVSIGHASPTDFWYDQAQPEWVVVLQGTAELRFDDETIRMKTGDAILIPARRKHRVEATTSDPPTVWLAVHFDETSAMASPAQDPITPRNDNPTTTLGGHPLFGLFIAFAICFGAAALGSLATAPEIGGWYQSLNKPSWQPPNWLFGPVWSLLFGMMAISAWLIWRPAGFSAARTPLLLFAIQLILNVVWSWLFFRLHRPDLAFFEIILLWVAILLTMLSFFGRSTTAGWLLVPYITWVSFAALLNLTIWRMNLT